MSAEVLTRNTNVVCFLNQNKSIQLQINRHVINRFRYTRRRLIESASARQSIDYNWKFGSLRTLIEGNLAVHSFVNFLMSFEFAKTHNFWFKLTQKFRGNKMTQKMWTRFLSLWKTACLRVPSLFFISAACATSDSIKWLLNGSKIINKTQKQQQKLERSLVTSHLAGKNAFIDTDCSLINRDSKRGIAIKIID